MSKIQDRTPSVVDQVARLIFIASIATPQEWHDGLHWYDYMVEMSQRLAHKYSVTPQQVSCLLALHSKNCRWAENVRRAELHLQGVPVGFKSSIAKGNDVLADSSDPFRHVVGPKINPFAHCGAGDFSKVATDRWAQRAAYATMDDNACDRWISRKGERDNMIEAYTLAAAHYGIHPAQLQAIVWVVVRGESF